MRGLSFVVVCAIACARTGGPPAASVQLLPDAGPAGTGSPADGGTASGGPPDAGAPPASPGEPPASPGDAAEAWCVPPEGNGPGPLAEAEPGLPSDCTGFLPPGPGVPIVAVRQQGMGFGCSAASSDEAGTVALGSFSVGGATGEALPTFWELLSPDGSSAGSFLGDGIRPLHSGFAAVLENEGSFPASQAFLFSFAQDSPPVQNVSVRMDAYPRTGAIAVEEPSNIDQFWLTAHRFGPAGDPIRTSDVLEGPFSQRPRAFAVAMALDGWSLAIFSGEPESDPARLYARWIDPDGRGSGTPFATGIAMGTLLWMRPLFDGSIAVRIDGNWIARVRRSGAEPAPAWLAALAGRDIVPFARGYAVPATLAAPSQQTGCTTAVELRAPAGNLCARLALEAPIDGAEVGADGTLVLRGPGADYHSCRWRFWSGLVR